jgi:hypothetical protein
VGGEVEDVSEGPSIGHCRPDAPVIKNWKSDRKKVVLERRTFYGNLG